MKFQNQRGGRIILANIQCPEKGEWGTPLEAMEAALALEKKVNQALLDLHKIATNDNDYRATLRSELHHLRPAQYRKLGAG